MLRRSKSNEEAADTGRVIGESVRRAPWHQHRLAGRESKSLVTNLDDVLSCEAVEPFVLFFW
jgi:hypothetical protein